MKRFSTTNRLSRSSRRASLTVMFITNEFILTAINKTPNIVKSSLKDAELFTKDAHKQITFNVHDSINIAVERIKIDLESNLFSIFVPMIW